MNKTAKSIISCLFRYFNTSNYPYFSCNTNALSHEADFVAVSRSNYITECEIKISRSDFLKDFKKVDKHLRMSSRKWDSLARPNYFYFVCPGGLIHENEVPEYAGLIWVGDRGICLVIKNAPLLHKVKASEGTIIRLLRSVMYKYFSRPTLKQEQIPLPLK